MDDLVLRVAASLPSVPTYEDLADEIVYRLRAGGLSDATIRNTLLNYPPREVPASGEWVRG
jgi:hypothetical protein